MRQYLDSSSLASSLKRVIRDRGVVQADLAQAVSATQGEISRIIRGQFKTENRLVREVCKYAKIKISEFRLPRAKISPASEAAMALSLACKGQRAREKVVVRILRAINDLD